jgi:hypothetical protein
MLDLARLLVQIRVIPLALPQLRISHAQVGGNPPTLEESDKFNRRVERDRFYTNK